MKNTIARRLCVADAMTFVPAWHAVDVRPSATGVRVRDTFVTDAALTAAYGAAGGTTVATTTKPSTTPVASSASSPPV